MPNGQKYNFPIFSLYLVMHEKRRLIQVLVCNTVSVAYINYSGSQ